ncbi:PQQ-like beta-propeller repeat protein [bacterium]|nr:PQQ-like beta-propeller repeat protein [bacterium]
MKKYIFILISFLILAGIIFYTETRDEIRGAIKEAKTEVEKRVSVDVKVESIPFEKHIVSNHYTNTKSHLDYLSVDSDKIWITKGGIIKGDTVNRVLNATDFKTTTKGYSGSKDNIDKIFIGYPFGFIMVNSSIIQYYKFGKEISKCIQEDKLYCIYDGNKVIVSDQSPYTKFYEFKEESQKIKDIGFYQNELIALSEGSLIFYGVDKKRVVKLNEEFADRVYIFGNTIYITSDTHIYKYENKILTTFKEFPAAISLYDNGKSTTIASLHGTVWKDDQILFKVDALVNNMVVENDSIYLLTNKGVYYYQNGEVSELENHNIIQGDMITVFTPFHNNLILVGYFEGGIDTLDINSGKVEPFIKTVGGVNDIIYKDDKLYVATTNGIYLYSSNGIQERVYNQKDGLLGNSVSKIEFIENTLFAGTEGGISALQGDSFTSIYALHGLINNRVYTISYFNGYIYVGTLGGVSELRYLTVKQSWSHKDISTPWITSISHVGNLLFVGTYGGGVFKYDGKEFKKLSEKGKKIYINPNSFENYKEYALFGTLAKGIYIYNTKKDSGFYYEELPTLNVTSLKVINKNLYIGTDFGFATIDIEKVLAGLPEN